MRFALHHSNSYSIMTHEELDDYIDRPSIEMGGM